VVARRHRRGARQARRFASNTLGRLRVWLTHPRSSQPLDFRRIHRSRRADLPTTSLAFCTLVGAISALALSGGGLCAPARRRRWALGQLVALAIAYGAATLTVALLSGCKARSRRTPSRGLGTRPALRRATSQPRRRSWRATRPARPRSRSRSTDDIDARSGRGQAPLVMRDPPVAASSCGAGCAARGRARGLPEDGQAVMPTPRIPTGPCPSWRSISCRLVRNSPPQSCRPPRGLSTDCRSRPKGAHTRVQCNRPDAKGRPLTGPLAGRPHAGQVHTDPARSTTTQGAVTNDERF
jgi:hypothetical protein